MGLNLHQIHTTISFLVPTTNLIGSAALFVASSIHLEILYNELSSDKSKTTTTTEISVEKKNKPGPEVIKLFSSSAQLSMNFQLLINAEIVKISGKCRFKPQKLVIYPAD